MEDLLKQILVKIESLNDKIDAHDKSNKEDFRKLEKKIDNITEVVSKTMEDVVDLKGQLENRILS